MELKWFKATTYTQGIGQIFGLIRKELIALQPIDSPDIAWDRGAEGIKARIVKKNVEDVKSRTPDSGEIAASGGGSSASIYFAKIKVINEDGTYTCAMSKTGDFGNMEELPTMVVYPIQTPWNSNNVINYAVGSVIIVQCIPQQAFGY